MGMCDVMIDVLFCSENEIADNLLEFAVIIATYKNKYIFCRHKERVTWEVPGGHREDGENIFETAERELYEETGAVDFELTPVSVYGVKIAGQITYGKLFVAKITQLGKLPSNYEIAEIILCDDMPKELTYPEIQPELWRCVRMMF